MGRITYRKSLGMAEHGSGSRIEPNATDLAADVFFDRGSLLNFIIDGVKELEIEQLDGLFFDRRGKFIDRYIISRGTLDKVWISSRALMCLCIEIKAMSFILVHSKTSESSWLSLEDIEAIRNVERAARVLGFHFLDHFVVADGVCISMRSEGCFNYRCPSYSVRPMGITLERVSLLLTAKAKKYLSSVNETGALPKVSAGTERFR